MGRIHGDLPDRTFKFSLAILAIVDRLPSNNKGWIVTRQLVRSGTAMGANIAEADHAHTATEFARCCNIAGRRSGGPAGVCTEELPGAEEDPQHPAFSTILLLDIGVEEIGPAHCLNHVLDAVVWFRCRCGGGVT